MATSQAYEIEQYTKRLEKRVAELEAENEALRKPIKLKITIEGGCLQDTETNPPEDINRLSIRIYDLDVQSEEEWELEWGEE